MCTRVPRNWYCRSFVRSFVRSFASFVVLQMYPHYGFNGLKAVELPWKRCSSSCGKLAQIRVSESVRVSQSVHWLFLSFFAFFARKSQVSEECFVSGLLACLRGIYSISIRDFTIDYLLSRTRKKWFCRKRGASEDVARCVS